MQFLYNLVISHKIFSHFEQRAFHFISYKCEGKVQKRKKENLKI